MSRDDRKFLWIVAREQWRAYSPVQRRRAVVLYTLLTLLIALILLDLYLLAYLTLERA